MIDQIARLRKVVEDHLSSIKLGDSVGAAVGGPSTVMMPTPEGLKPQVVWVIMVTLKHDKLLGQTDIGTAVPVPGVLPPDDAFRKATSYLLEECRRLRHEANSPPLPAEGPAKEGKVIPPGLDLTGRVPR